MTLSASSIRRLTAMGLTPWQLRSENQAGPAEVQEPLLRLVHRGRETGATAVVEWAGHFSLGDDHAGGALLLKIVGALGISIDRLSVYQHEPGAAPSLLELEQPVFWFVAARRDVPGVAVVPALGEMLADAGHKKRAWAVLKPWADQFQ